MENLSWEEKLYWNHFRTIHFGQFLLADFENHLNIPEKFINNLNRELPATVSLKGPSGLTWNVGLVKTDDTLAFKHGWNQFVRDNCLAENDFLIFKYTGETQQFAVLMFSAQSLCEKEETYFIGDSAGDSFLASPNGVAAGCSSLGLTNDEVDDNEDFITQAEENASLEASETQCYPMKKIYAKEYLSNRRPVTEEEICRTKIAARAAANNEGVVVTLRPTSVYKKFFVVIPKEWMRKHLKPVKQDVIVRHENKTWVTKYSYVKSRNSGGLHGGWMHFVVDNNLEEFDVCVFQLAAPQSKPIVLDVTIFRVVDDITPLTAVF